ncbi:MAG: adenylate/guanylate cyclase domain-containing protein [Granulosicoccus sp.]|nr:adenylate/guanylate cyclase domain-containing protein [Granulosicoccus sp.]
MQFTDYIKSSFFRSMDMSMLPERVQRSLRQRERANEVVVRVFQLAIVVMFSTLYSLSVKTGQATDFQPVPYVLFFYIVLSLVGLIWSIRSELPSWAVYCSIFFDFTLLYSLMISFHFQYEQPASFILKAPTLLYVFIFIALRAFRLEWKYVAAAGITGAVGWIVVVLYVTTIDPENTMITRSYVQYLTSNSILIGAEIDKIISILAVTGILTLVVNGSSNLLVTAVSEESAAREFSRFFDKRIAHDIRSSRNILEAGQGERRNLAVINIDIRGFSLLAANHEPSQIMQVLSAYQARVVPILQAHDAIIDKFMGDGIMATTGIDNDEIPYSRKAIEAAEAVLLDSRRWQEEEPLLASRGALDIGIGIASGAVAFGAVGQGDRLEMTVIGSPVNTSAKLEKHNKVLNSNCIISRITWDKAIEEGYIASLDSEFMKTNIDGIEGAMDIVILKV